LHCQEPLLNLSGLLEVFGALSRQLDHGLHQGGLGGTEVSVLAVESLHDFAGELPRLGSAKKHNVPFHPQTKAVVRNDAAGVGMVGRDFGFKGIGVHEAGREDLLLLILPGDALQHR
jgi:hypothetical protein